MILNCSRPACSALLPSTPSLLLLPPNNLLLLLRLLTFLVVGGSKRVSSCTWSGWEISQVLTWSYILVSYPCCGDVCVVRGINALSMNRILFLDNDFLFSSSFFLILCTWCLGVRRHLLQAYYMIIHPKTSFHSGCPIYHSRTHFISLSTEVSFVDWGMELPFK